jgi:Cu/Ag efflux protein CusF
VKRLFPATLIVFSLAAPGAFAAGDSAAIRLAQASPAPAIAMVDGVVKRVDKAAGKVTLSHPPLTNLGMPAMTMVFRVKDATWLDRMKNGDKVRFSADKVNGAYTVVQFESAL